jgi:hypothetical protein
MMNSMFSNPFGMFGMGPPAIASSFGATHMNNRPRTDLMTFGFPNMNRMFENIVSTHHSDWVTCFCSVPNLLSSFTQDSWEYGGHDMGHETKQLVSF